MNEIVPGLFLTSAPGLEAAEPYETDRIVNCTRDIGYRRPCAELTCVPVDDDLSVDAMRGLLAELPSVTAGVAASLALGRRVIGWTLDDAVWLTRERRREAFFWGVNFRPALLEWERVLGQQAA